MEQRDRELHVRVPEARPACIALGAEGPGHAGGLA